MISGFVYFQHKFPKAQVNVYVTVLQNDGSRKYQTHVHFSLNVYTSVCVCAYFKDMHNVSQSYIICHDISGTIHFYPILFLH